MSKRLSRKQIKEDIRHDEIQTALSSTYDRFQSHQKLIVGALIGAIVLAIGVAGARTYLKGRNLSAANDLAHAVKIYNAPIQEDGADPDDPKQPSFASEDERNARAREAMRAISGGAAEELAGLYLADLAMRKGERETARSHWQSYLKNHQGDILAVSIQVSMFRLDREDGKGEAVAEELLAQLEADKKSLPEEVILYELAETLDTLDRNEEAEEYYQRILDDYPQSPYSAKARQKTTS